MAKDKLAKNASKNLWYVEVGKLPTGKQPRIYLGNADDVTEDMGRKRLGITLMVVSR